MKTHLSDGWGLRISSSLSSDLLVTRSEWKVYLRQAKEPPRKKQTESDGQRVSDRVLDQMLPCVKLFPHARCCIEFLLSWARSVSTPCDVCLVVDLSPEGSFPKTWIYNIALRPGTRLCLCFPLVPSIFL